MQVPRTHEEMMALKRNVSHLFRDAVAITPSATSSAGVCYRPGWFSRPRHAWALVRLRGGFVMRHKPILDNEFAYTAGVIGLGLLPVAMAAAALFLR
jgi:hypothetical protein